MRSFRSILAATGLAAALAIGVGPAVAHHSFGHYAMDKTTEIEGVVSKWEWSNPHCWLFVDVAQPEGPPVTYGFELSSPGELLRRGWKRTSIKVGDKLKVSFRPMKDGTPAGLLARAVDAVTGKPIAGGAAANGSSPTGGPALPATPQ
jgi:Family of unknown function (DUF6152)